MVDDRYFFATYHAISAKWSLAPVCILDQTVKSENFGRSLTDPLWDGFVAGPLSEAWGQMRRAECNFHAITCVLLD